MDNKVTAAFLRMFAATILILLSFSAYAQNSYTVKLKLIDSKTSEPVSFATASLTVKGETTAAKYVLTDAQGAASLTKVKKGTYLFKAELMGYKTHQQEVVVDKNIDLAAFCKISKFALVNLALFNFHVEIIFCNLNQRTACD